MPKSVVITFGRFQPPTIGHEKLIRKVMDHAKSIGAEHRIYASLSQNYKTDPLQYTDKIRFLRKMFPKANIVSGGTEIATFMRALEQLDSEGYDTVHFVVGGDRVDEIDSTVRKYLGKRGEHGLGFTEFKVISAGERDPEAKGVEGMSASKMRAAAAAKDWSAFSKGLPKGFADGKKLYELLRKGMEKPMKKSKKKLGEEAINEVAPPSEKSEKFIKDKKSSFKDRYGKDWASYLYGVAWKQYNKRTGKETESSMAEEVVIEEEAEQLDEGYQAKRLRLFRKNKPLSPENADFMARSFKRKVARNERIAGGKFDSAWKSLDIRNKKKDAAMKAKGLVGVEESTLNEGGVKGALEDFMYSIPKNALSKIKTIMVNKRMTGVRKLPLIAEILKKSGLDDNLMGEDTAQIVYDYWDTFFGEPDPEEVNRFKRLHKEFQASMREETTDLAGSILEAMSRKDKKINRNRTLRKNREAAKRLASSEPSGEELARRERAAKEADALYRRVTGKPPLKESKMKDALADFMESIPKGAVEKLRPVMKIKNLTRRFDQINRVLKQYKVETNQMRTLGSYAANIVNDYFDTFHGENTKKRSWTPGGADDPDMNDSNRYESVDLTGDVLWEAVKERIPKNAVPMGFDKKAGTVTVRWVGEKGEGNVEEIPVDEIPDYLMPAIDPIIAAWKGTTPLKKRKTDRFGNIIPEPLPKGAKKAIEKAIESGTKGAKEIIDLFDEKPGKPITIYGVKHGGKDEYKMTIIKKQYMGEPTFMVKSSGRPVELRPTGAGLQIVDIKSKRILLDKGKDAEW